MSLQQKSMTKPKFNNKQNENLRFKYNDIDVNVWISRSVAVVGVIFASTNDGIRVLITKRSDTMIDEPGKISLPCGYLDWNESTYETMIREVCEETSLYLPDYNKYLIFDNDKKNYDMKDAPNVNRQNVTLMYINMYDFKDHMKDFPSYVEKYSCAETASVKWLKLVDFYQSDYYWAFNHDDTIKNALKYFNKNYQK